MHQLTGVGSGYPLYLSALKQAQSNRLRGKGGEDAAAIPHADPGFHKKPVDT